MMQDMLLHFDSGECSTVYEQPGFVISWCFLVVLIVTKTYFIDTLILSRLSGPHELIDGSST